MDFIVGLAMMARKFESIWVIMDRISKCATSYQSTPAMMLKDMFDRG
jgi:hypothetical protein